MSDFVEIADRLRDLVKHIRDGADIDIANMNPQILRDFADVFTDWEWSREFHPDEGGSKMYSFGGDGKWRLLVSPLRCSKEVPSIRLHKQCQGALGHAGPCWFYDISGSYCSHDPVRGVCIETPPGHEDWVSPLDKADVFWGSQSLYVEEVTDPELIAKLNDEDWTPDDACVIRPVFMEPSEDDDVD